MESLETQIINQTTEDLLLQQIIQTNQSLEQIQNLLTSIQDLYNILPKSIENVLNIQLKNMQDSLKSSQEIVQNEQKQNHQLVNLQLQKTIDFQESLDKATDTIIKQKAASLVDTLNPYVEKSKRLLNELSCNISTKTIGINSKLIEINNGLMRIHVGKVIIDYLIAALAAFVLGIFCTLWISQSLYGKMIERSYQAEMLIASKQGVSEYKSELTKNNSGIIKIKELEKEYIKNHKSDIKNADVYIQNLNDVIKQYRDNEFMKE